MPPTNPSLLDVESFEIDFGSWIQSNDDDMNWTRHIGTTGSYLTGPQNGLAYDGDYYIYTEASGSGYPNKEAIIYVPCVEVSAWNNLSFVFAYHMFGYSSEMGDLSVDVSTDSGKIIKFSPK